MMETLTNSSEGLWKELLGVEDFFPVLIQQGKRRQKKLSTVRTVRNVKLKIKSTANLKVPAKAHKEVGDWVDEIISETTNNRIGLF